MNSVIPPLPDPLPKGEGKSIPKTLEQAQRWSEFLLLETDDWFAKEIADNQARYEESLRALQDDAREEIDRILNNEEEDRPIKEIQSHVQRFFQHKGEMVLKIWEDRAWAILEEKKRKEDEIFAQWERWIDLINTH
jgi:Fe2+ transport system protein B